MNKKAILWLLDICAFDGLSKDFLLNANEEKLKAEVIDFKTFDYETRAEVFELALSSGFIEFVYHEYWHKDWIFLTPLGGIYWEKERNVNWDLYCSKSNFLSEDDTDNSEKHVISTTSYGLTFDIFFRIAKPKLFETDLIIECQKGNSLFNWKPDLTFYELKFFVKGKNLLNEYGYIDESNIETNGVWLSLSSLINTR